MNTEPPSQAYLQLVGDVESRHSDIVTGHMFGMANMKRHGRAFGGAYAGGLALKSPKHLYDQILGIPGATPFDPAERGTPMGLWIVLPADTSHLWPDLVDEAIEQLHHDPKEATR